jgi:phage/plasmid primase-like uncharacterized protein
MHHPPDPTHKNGWHLLHTDGIAAGAFGCWRSGLQSNWCAKSNTADKLQSLQPITPDGEKRFLSGDRVKGVQHG